ncbi:hypothetical protein OHA25_60580 (plasmid) [Nonomuraea sp. NBC_00507]|uniref:hypothetical protein n=1 Tax=Nonomuraea sp. NBC_00507 TaxID=2976002 RepID=UPI002E16CCF9
MDINWENVHTDYTTTVKRPAPRGLTESEADWRAHLEHETPNGGLLRNNSITQALTSGRPIHLMHTTVALDAIRRSGQLYASTGCLMAALYCALLTPEPAGLRPHNLGTYLLETKKHTRTLVFEITPDAPVPPKGTDYLRAGPIHLKTYLDHRDFLTPAEDAHLRQVVVDKVRAAAPVLDTLLANAVGKHTPDTEFIDQFAAAVAVMPFLGYLYFEVLSEYLLLHSVTPETKSYALTGEMNNRLYKRLAFSAVQGMDQLFDLGRFAPRHERLLQIIGQVEPGLESAVVCYTRRRLSHLFACISLDSSLDAASITFRHMRFDELATTAPGLLGHLIFRHMRIMDRYPQLYLCFEEAKALSLWNYWNTQGIPTPYNGTLPKGEIGINTAYPRSTYKAWVAEACERGLLHPTEELRVTPVPRLADLSLTAMRRDETGRATGHPRRPAAMVR